MKYNQLDEVGKDKEEEEEEEEEEEKEEIVMRTLRRGYSTVLNNSKAEVFLPSFAMHHAAWLFVSELRTTPYTHTHTCTHTQATHTS